jgi:hypothetical protein
MSLSTFLILNPAALSSCSTWVSDTLNSSGGAYWEVVFLEINDKQLTTWSDAFVKNFKVFHAVFDIAIGVHNDHIIGFFRLE